MVTPTNIPYQINWRGLCSRRNPRYTPALLLPEPSLHPGTARSSTSQRPQLLLWRGQHMRGGRGTHMYHILPVASSYSRHHKRSILSPILVIILVMSVFNHVFTHVLPNMSFLCVNFITYLHETLDKSNINALV